MGKGFEKAQYAASNWLVVLATGVASILAWIIGYAPADNPAVAFCVLVEGQLDTSTWGGKTAGPVARDMLTTWARKAEPGTDTPLPSDCQRR